MRTEEIAGIALEENDGQEKGMLIPKLKRINRKSNRLLDKEANKMLPYLLKIEEVFLECIKHSEHTEQFTYDEIYKNFNARWINTCKNLLIMYRPKHYLINNTYFRDKYAPKEN